MLGSPEDGASILINSPTVGIVDGIAIGWEMILPEIAHRQDPSAPPGSTGFIFSNLATWPPSISAKVAMTHNSFRQHLSTSISFHQLPSASISFHQLPSASISFHQFLSASISTEEHLVFICRGGGIERALHRRRVSCWRLSLSHITRRQIGHRLETFFIRFRLALLII